MRRAEGFLEVFLNCIRNWERRRPAWLPDKISSLSLLAGTGFPCSYLSPCWLWAVVPSPFIDLFFLNCVLRLACITGTTGFLLPQQHLWTCWPWLLSLFDLFWPFLFIMILLWQTLWFLVFDPNLIHEWFCYALRFSRKGNLSTVRGARWYPGARLWQPGMLRPLSCLRNPSLDIQLIGDGQLLHFPVNL